MQSIVLFYLMTKNSSLLSSLQLGILFIHSLEINVEFNSSAVTLKSLLCLGRFPCFAQLLLFFRKQFV